MTASGTPLRPVAGGPPRQATGAPALRRALWVLGALAGLLAFATVFVRAGDEERALRRLPSAERAALYGRTLETLRSVCAGGRDDELRHLCRDQAQLALLFPECDAACQGTARELLRTSTR